MIIDELVHVPPVRTVIRLADLNDDGLRRHLVESFVLTGEVSFAMTNILKKIALGQGEGFFVIGNYGSGKSHLLNMLSLIIGSDHARRLFEQSCRENRSRGAELLNLANGAASGNPLLVEISLVEHSNREHLEGIVLKAIGTALHERGIGQKVSPPPDLTALTRREAFEFLKQALRADERSGLVLLVDELSEYLRSKDNVRAYNEDVRFLQYLGEFAEAIPAWIVATMQENIENTGELSGELLHKIKDRYPTRFQLSGEHVKEIVSGRLVQKKDGASNKLARILEEMEEAFSSLPFSRQDFFALYPVHPATVELLDELRPLFSQHRGVIDFIHYRLAGDPARDIERFLDRPAEELLTPDYIFDHFRDRLRETVETNPYSDQVFHYFEREAGSIFPDPADSATALRLVKVLILGALARAPKTFGTDELTRLLLHRYSGLESAVNYDYISEIMEKLLAHGAYITAEEKADGIKSYTVDVKADAALLMKKKLARISASLADGDRRLIDALLPWVDENILPLQRLQQEPFYETDITWQNTTRRGKVFFTQPSALAPEPLEELRDELEDGETDFVFFMVPPFFAARETSTSPWKAMLEAIDPELRRSTALWVPRGITAAEEELMRSAYAHQLLHEEYKADSSPAGKQVGIQVAAILPEERRKIKELFRNLYFQGHLRSGAQMLAPSSFGYTSFAELLSQAAAEILKERFPRHPEIRPLSEQVSGTLMQRTLDLLFSPQLEGDSLERGTRMVIENHLAPLKLVKKKGQDYLLEINPKTSPLIADFLSRIPHTGRVALSRLYRHLRKGPFGLCASSFQVLGTAAILSGAVSAYQGGKRLAPSQINFYRFWNIEEIGPGTLIRPEMQKILADIPFLAAPLRRGPLTFALQQQAWESIVLFKEEWIDKINSINTHIERLKDRPVFPAVNWDNLAKASGRLSKFLSEIKTSYASQEGLERFLAAYQSAPMLADDWKRLASFDRFINEDLTEILRLGHYLQDSRLSIPPGKNCEDLRQRHLLLLELLEEESLLWEEKYRERLKREFKQFREQYLSFYTAEHDRAVGPARIKPYRAIMETDAYQLLERLGKINAVVVEDDLVDINRHLAGPLESECLQADELRLREDPVCSCGYRPGQAVDLPDRADLEKKILQGIASYLTFLQDPAQSQKIKAHADHLEMVGRRRDAEPLQNLLRIESSGSERKLVNILDPLINRHTIDQINRALTGDAMIVERTVEELFDLLADRVFNTAQLQDLFQRWLAGGESKPPDYIRVTRQDGAGWLSREDEPHKPDRPAEAARTFLKERFPRLIAPAGGIPIEKTFALAMLSAWLNSFAPAGGEIQGSPSPGDLFEKLTKEQTGLESMELKEYSDQLTALGQFIAAEKDFLQNTFLEQAAKTATALLPAEQLLELFYRDQAGTPRRFESLLDLMLDEPFFAAVSDMAAARTAVQISAEESVPQLNIMTGMLGQAGKTSARESTGLTASHRTGKAAALEILHDLARSNLILRETERMAQSPPERDKNWERFYRLIAPFELLLGRLDQAPARAIVPETTTKRWRRHYASLLEPLVHAFEDCYSSGDFSSRQTLADLFIKLPGWAVREKPTGGVFLVILDGIRLDLWTALLDQTIEIMPFNELREGLTWAAQPSITETQIQPLIAEGLLGHVLNMDDRLVAELVADPEAFLAAADNSGLLSGRTAPLKVIKFNFADDKIHHSRDSLPVLLEELQLQSRKMLHPLFEYLPGGALLLLAADHGFRTNLQYNKNNKEDVLYLHGGNTFFEILAPWTLLKKKP